MNLSRQAHPPTAERRRRLYVVLICAPSFLATLLLLGSIFQDGQVFLSALGLQFSATLLLIVCLYGISGAGVIIMYLQTGFGRITSDSSVLSNCVDEIVQLKRDLKALRESTGSTGQLANRLAELETRFDDTQPNTSIIPDADRNELVNRLRELIDRTATEDYLDELRRSVEQQIRVDITNDLSTQHTNSTMRLTGELSNLSRRGNVNLTLGIFTAVSGIVLLGYFVWHLQPSQGNPFAFSESFIPRISLVILVELFAYFFLRLYSVSLSEIKFFQNEITNVESKYIALRTALFSSSEKSVENVMRELSQTERNFILEKGQTTSALKRSKADKETIGSLTRALGKMTRNR